MEAVIPAVTGLLNLNGLLQGRNERKRQKVYGKILNICLHYYACPRDNYYIEFRSTFEPRPGTANLFCNKCGLNATEQMVKRFKEDLDFKLKYDHNEVLDRYIKHDKRFLRLAKKLNKLGGLVTKSPSHSFVNSA